MNVNLRKRKDKSALNAIIEKVVESDYPIIVTSDNVLFDWTLERHNEVYKIFLKSSDNEILGLMSLVDTTDEKVIQINLLEVGKTSRGKRKEIDNIAGCLIAFAIRISLERGYGGAVVLELKSRLYKYYQKKYGFIEAGYMVLIDRQAALNLMNKYLVNSPW